MMFGKGAFLDEKSDFSGLMKFNKAGTYPVFTAPKDSEIQPNPVYSDDYKFVVNTKFDDIEDFNITSYSYSFYYKPTLNAPTPMDLGYLRGWWRTMGGLSENGDCGAAGRAGDRTLCIWERYWNDAPGYHVTTYGINHNNWNMWRNLNIDWVTEYDNYWSFFYFGYNGEKQQAYFFMKNMRNNRVISEVWNDVRHIMPLMKVFFQLGRNPSY
jgi:hypothetical protein